jgi:4-hydroxy-4-methyl-2-oxoglutarate aldolase
VWGDILTTVAAQDDIAGIVIDGACRDTDRWVQLGYPVYSRSRTMPAGKDRVSAEATTSPSSKPVSGSSQGTGWSATPTTRW